MTETKAAVKLVGSAKPEFRNDRINAAQTQLAKLELIKADKKYTLTIKAGNAGGKRACQGSSNDAAKRARMEQPPATPPRKGPFVEEISEESEAD